MSADLPLILLPPSEGKAAGGEGPAWAPDTMRYGLDVPRERCMRALVQSMKWSTPKRAALLGVKGDALAAATAANLEVATSPTMPAIERYTGVLYDALDHSSLPAASRRRSEQCLVTFSGLFGLVAPGDPLPAYKLKMGASLPRLGKLSTWWRPHLGAVLDPVTEGRRVWNLLPNEHAAAWSAPAGSQVRTVRFLEERPDGSLTAVSHWNKLLKGALVRHLLDHPGIDAEDLRDWEHPLGYRLESADPGTGGATVLSFVQRR